MKELNVELDAVRGLVHRHVSCLQGLDGQTLGVVLGGKMLRARLAVRLAGLTSVSRELIRGVAAAVEMVHAASLLHDDVIDGAERRRGRRAFWRTTSPEASILTGDLLLAEAACLLAEAGDGRVLAPFCRKVREMCEAEAVHELLWRGRQLTEEQCLAIARGKTGALFAFVGEACAGDGRALREALEECGYRLGTGYQLADDLLDLCGAEGAAGKTLGTDCERGKMTLPALYLSEQAQGDPKERVGFDGLRSPRACRGVAEQVAGRITEFLDAARALLEAWPVVQAAVVEFINVDLLPTVTKCLGTEQGEAPFRGSTGSPRSELVEGRRGTAAADR